ncbi:hypothetical protein [Desulfurobacterium crinifex]
MEDRVFVDTNIWIYALTESKVETDKKKRKVSLSLFESLIAQEKTLLRRSLMLRTDVTHIATFSTGVSTQVCKN